MNRDIETQDYILKQASESNVKFIRLWFTDINGGLKGFAINVEDLNLLTAEKVYSSINENLDLID